MANRVIYKVMDAVDQLRAGNADDGREEHPRR